MKFSLIFIVSITLLLLINLVVAEEMSLRIPIKKEVESIKTNLTKKILANFTPTQVKQVLREQMVAGEVKLNITPHLPQMPVFPPIACPAFLRVELPYKPYVADIHHSVMRYFHTKNLTLREVCEDKAKVESLVREALEKVNLTQVCEKLEKASENCKEVKPLPCKKIENALSLCLQGLKRCKRSERKIVGIAREVWKEKVEEQEKELEAQEEASEELWEASNTSGKASRVSPIRIEGVILKCYKEEKFCQSLKEKLDRCKSFKERCAPRCEVISNMAAKCKVALTNKEALVTKIVDFILKRCKLINYLPPEIEEVENETIPPAEIQPVIIVTQPNLTSDQEAKLQDLVEKLERIYTDDTWVYKAFIRANRIEDLRELDFVMRVSIDHVARAVQRGTFKELPELPKFAPKTAEILPHLEGVKEKIKPELQPLITESEVEILNHTEDITNHQKEEKARGVGYAILKFFGLQAARERRDARFLEEKARSMDKVAEKLRDIAKTEENTEIKAAILEQVAKLQESINAIHARAEAKYRGALGIWSLLGLR